jgi:hypothetical protein
MVGDTHLAGDPHIIGDAHIIGDSHIIGNSHIVGDLQVASKISIGANPSFTMWRHANETIAEYIGAFRGFRAVVFWPNPIAGVGPTTPEPSLPRLTPE